MPVPLRLLTSPLRLAGGLNVDQLGSLVSMDALLRWARADGRPASAVVTTLVGNVATQHAVERELAREGHDRESLGREQFVARLRGFEALWREQAAELLGTVGVDLGVDLTVASTDSAAVVDAARIAFVRLFDTGLLELADRVVSTCPRCSTVVHAADADRGQVEVELLTIRLPHTERAGAVEVALAHPELLPGAVAVVVPEDHPSAGARVALPMSGREIPVVADPTAPGSLLLVPAHDARALDMARRHGLAAIEVLAADGTICDKGPLDGLARFAARAAARDLLAAENAIVAAAPAREIVERCRGCSTILVPRLGRHWFLRTGEAEIAAADAVRHGGVTFSPTSARDEFLAWAGHSPDWCLSHQLWGGHPIPVSRCTDCGQPAVQIDAPDTCRKCLGALKADDAVMDARFLGVVWALAAAGWPVDERGVEHVATNTTLLVRPGGLFTWAVPMAALALRLAGSVPFTHVSVHAAVGDIDGEDAAAVVAAASPAAVRLAVMDERFDLARAETVVERLRRPPPGDADIAVFAAACTTAFAEARPAPAVGALATIVEQGVAAADVAPLRRLAEPLVGGADGLG